MGEVTSLWVFGYGSLVWKPGFQHGQTAIGYVEGLARRFWQGNETHRGVPGKPGRVATLVEEQGEVTHGIAMELKGEEALEYLNNREMTLGGYLQKITQFHATEKDIPPFPVLVFVATPQSKHWLGPADSQYLAKQVVSSSGPSGHNVEYVIKLAQWLRKTFPEVVDEHLYSLETQVLAEVEIQGLCLNCLLGDELQDPAPAAVTAPAHLSNPPARQTTYCANLTVKSLRCVKL